MNEEVQSLPGSQTGRSPAPTLPWGQWASLRYTSFAGGWGSCGFQEHSVSCEWFCVPCLRYLVCNFHQLLQVLIHILCVSALSTPTFSRPFSCTFSKLICGGTVVSTVLQLHFCGHLRVHFCTPTPTSICGCTAMPLFYTYTHLQCYSFIFAAIFVYIFVHPCLSSSVDAQRCLYSTPTLICGCTAVSTVLFAASFVYIFIHPRLHSSVDAQVTSLFYTYTHLWMYSGFYSATATFSRPFSCTSTYIHTYTHRGPSLALFSRWQRVHGYTSLIRPRLHSSLHSLHSTSTLSEHFRDPGAYIHPTFYIYI